MVIGSTGRPLCDLCGHRHWRGEAHIWDEAETASSSPPVPKPVGEVPVLPSAETVALILSKRNREKYNAYQKQYQRDLRKAKKAGLTVSEWRRVNRGKDGSDATD